MSDQDTAVVEPQATDTSVEAQATDTAADEPGEALLSALRAERATVKALRDELEKARLEGLSETERAVEEARRAGYEAAMSEASKRLIAQTAAAAAAAAGFADPADVARLVDLDGLQTEAEVAKAVAALAKSKPYLLRRTLSVEQGPRNLDAAAGGSTDDWLRRAAKR